MSPIVEPAALNAVKEFHNLFDLPVLDTPTIPDLSRCQLRINLLQEELDELKEAISEKNLTEISDALADLQYVLSGAVLEFGLQDVFADLFSEVQRSNMSKACSSLEEAQATVDHYAALDQQANIVQKEDKWLVYRTNDKKVLKSVNYSPANLGEKLSMVIKH